MIPLLLALALPGYADSAPVPAEPVPAVLMGEVLSPEEYGAWVVGTTDAMGLAWHRALARLDPDGGPAHQQQVLDELDAELDTALGHLGRVPPYAGDAALTAAAERYAADLGQTLHDGLPVLLELLSAELPDDAGLQQAVAVWAALTQRGAQHRAALDEAQAAFAARHGGLPAPSLVPWDVLPAWAGPDELGLPGPVGVVLAARRHNALVRRQAALVGLWSRVLQAPDATEQQRIHSELAVHRAALEQAGPLAGHDGLRQAVLAYAETLDATLAQDRDSRAQRLARAHRAFTRAQAEYQAWWGFEAYLAWATGVRAGG